MRVGVGGGEVVDVARRDERELCLGGELDELRVDALLDVEAGVLELDVGVLAAEDLGEPVEVGARVGRPVLLERLADPSREAAGERDQAGRVGLEQLPVDARLREVALEVAERGELDEVRVALVRLGEERQVRVAAGARAAVVGDVDLAADDRLHALVLRRLEELDRARERAVIGERDGRHLELRGALRERGDPAGAVEDRVLAVDVQVDEVGGHGRVIIPTGPDDPRRGPRSDSRSLRTRSSRRGSNGHDPGTDPRTCLERTRGIRRIARRPLEHAAVADLPEGRPASRRRRRSGRTPTRATCARSRASASGRSPFRPRTRRGGAGPSRRPRRGRRSRGSSRRCRPRSASSSAPARS